MSYTKIILAAAFAFCGTLFINGQTTDLKPSVQPSTSKSQVSPLKSSPAYAELLLRKTERESELEEFLLDYTEEFPKIKEIRFAISALNKEMNRVLAVKTADAAKLTPALGKLLVRKADLEVELWNLREKYKDDHPEVKRAARKVQIHESAVKEILP
jgi:uncharacterized protein involved in exopolysaccharide biosynthesis